MYSDAIYSTPIISLAAGNDVAHRGARVRRTSAGRKIFLIRVAPVPTWKGRKSFALPEFDPFWERVQELDLVVGMHSGDSGYTRYTNEWEGLGDREMTHHRRTAALEPDIPRPVVGEGQPRRRHGVDHRPRSGHPLPEAAASCRSSSPARWIRPFYRKLQRAYDQVPVLFDENPVDVFNRNVWVHAFHEPDPKGLIDLGIPADHIMFGSDFPHPEGMEDPLAYSEVVKDLPMEDQALIMGGALEKAMKVGAHA